MRLPELKAFLAKTKLASPPYPRLQAVKVCTCTYSDILQSMIESLVEHDMTFKQAWKYEIDHSEKTHYGRKVRDIIAQEGKTLMDIWLAIEDKELLSDSNWFGQPFDLWIEKELGNYADE